MYRIPYRLPGVSFKTGTKQLSLRVVVLIDALFLWYNFELLYPGHKYSGTAIESPTRLFAHSKSYEKTGATGDGIV